MLTKIGERLVKTRDDCSEEFAVEKLDDRLVNHSETINRSCELVMSQCRGVQLNRTQFTGMTTLAGNRVGRTLLTRMTLLMILMSLMQALQYPVSRLSATCFYKVASCSSRDGASHVHSSTP